MCSSSKRVAAALGVVVAMSLVGVEARAAAPRSTLDPRIARSLALGHTGPSRLHVAHPGRTRVMIELSTDAEDAALAALEAAGAQLSRVEGKVVRYHRFVPATVTAASVATLSTLPGVKRLVHAGQRGPLPLDRSAELMHLADARSARPMQDLLTGAGTLIGDIDSLTDPFQPTFFKGDGGYFDWIDVDGDGKFTPGKDAIDLDRDGKAGPGETAQMIQAMTLDVYDATLPVARAVAGFDPSTDWLYLDTNGNGRRDYGAAAGFDDATPAFGEPLFVPDDLDRSGKLDVGERVVRLSTSKFRKIYVDLAGDVVPGVAAAHDVFVRGTNLSSAKVNYSNGMIEGFADAFHATGVDTILAGDVPLVGRRWVGIAPEAELVVGWETADEQYPITATMWAYGEKPDVMLYELAPWTGDPLDGTDALSMLIDDSSASITHVCPTGDQGSARKHAHADVTAGATSSQLMNLPANAQGITGEPLTEVEISLDIRGGTPSAAKVIGPKGDVIDLLSSNPSGTLASGAAYFAVSGITSARGTYFLDVELYDPDGSHPPDVGDWNVQVTAGSDALSIDSFAQDDISSWGLGAGWDASIASDASTAGIPSVADHCIAVNAIPDHLDGNGAQSWYDMSYWDYAVPTGYTDMVGQIRAYTPRGPRIDGVVKPDVAAPDNPWVAAESDGSESYGYGSFRLFGGTSGASPHVAGVAALLAQAGIHGSAAMDAIHVGADHDATTGSVPNGDYGYGRLDAAAALGVTVVGEDFSATLTADRTMAQVGQDVVLTATATGATGASAAATTGLQAEWDDGYDGSWDLPYAASVPRTVSVTKPGRYAYKVRLRNGGGHLAEALVYVSFVRASGCSCDVAGAGTRTLPVALVIWALMLSSIVWLRARVVRRGRVTRRS